MYARKYQTRPGRVQETAQEDERCDTAELLFQMRSAVGQMAGLTRTMRIHRWIRIGVLLMVIGLMLLARAVFSHPARQRNSMCRPDVARAA
jgi:hypothetical protein